MEPKWAPKPTPRPSNNDRETDTPKTLENDANILKNVKTNSRFSMIFATWDVSWGTLGGTWGALGGTWGTLGGTPSTLEGT